MTVASSLSIRTLPWGGTGPPTAVRKLRAPRPNRGRPRRGYGERGPGARRRARDRHDHKGRRAAAGRELGQASFLTVIVSRTAAAAKKVTRLVAENARSQRLGVAGAEHFLQGGNAL